MRERWRDEGNQAVTISRSEPYKVQGELRTLQITTLCDAVRITECSSPLHIHVPQLIP